MNVRNISIIEEISDTSKQIRYSSQNERLSFLCNTREKVVLRELQNFEIKQQRKLPELSDLSHMNSMDSIQ